MIRQSEVAGYCSRMPTTSRGVPAERSRVYIRFIATVVFVVHGATSKGQDLTPELLSQAFDYRESSINQIDANLEITYRNGDENKSTPTSESNSFITVGMDFRTIHVDWLMSAKKVRCTIAGEHDGGWKVEDDQVFDGEVVILHSPLGHKAVIETDTSQMSIDLRRTVGIYDQGNQPWSQLMKADGVTVERKEENGATFFVATVPDKKYKKTDRIWLDAEKGFAVVRDEYYGEQGVLERIIEYSEFREFPNGIWIPQHSLQRVLDPAAPRNSSQRDSDRQSKYVTETQITRLAVNDSMSDERFRVTLPIGTLVYDSRLKLAYETKTLSGDLNLTSLLQEAATEAAAAGVSPTDHKTEPEPKIQQTASGELKPPMPISGPANRYLYFGVTGVAAIVVLALIFLYRVKKSN
jgi:hypothetical protein